MYIYIYIILYTMEYYSAIKKNEIIPFAATWTDLEMIRPSEVSQRKTNIRSVQFSHWVVSDSFRPHESQHARPPCPSPTPGIHPNPCPLSQWCYPTISSSVIPFSCPQSFPASGSFPMSQLFASGGQSIGVSASASVLPMNIQDWFPLGWKISYDIPYM